jgi:soluble lytic murein transglycosylase-like protein
MTGDGIILEGERSPERTIGEPVTVRQIWANYATVIKAAASTFGVPTELIVTVIAVESHGVVDAERTEPDERQSVGLMQTLVGTAREALNRPTLSPADLLKPDISINAGAAYIAKLRQVTNYDPILNGAAYNAGELAKARLGVDNNRYNLRSTGDHLDRTRRFYNDTVAVSRAEGWFASLRPQT